MKEITVGEFTFQVERLKVKASLGGLRLVGKVLLPALAEAHSAPAGQIGNAAQKVVEGLDCLPELLDLFAAVTKFTGPNRANPTTLAPFVDDVFGGRPDQVVEYLVQCVQAEYGPFLADGGLLKRFMPKVAAPTATPASSNSPST